MYYNVYVNTIFVEQFMYYYRRNYTTYALGTWCEEWEDSKRVPLTSQVWSVITKRLTCLNCMSAWMRNMSEFDMLLRIV